jgi:hypothetical protein
MNRVLSASIGMDQHGTEQAIRTPVGEKLNKSINRAVDELHVRIDQPGDRTGR